MSKQLEIFQDTSIYTSESIPENNLVYVPLDVRKVSTFIRNNNQMIPIQSQLLISGSLESNSAVNVFDKYGNSFRGILVSEEDGIVSIINEGRTIFIKKPIIIESIASGNVYKVESGDKPVILKGINSKISWSPMYYFYIDQEEQLVNMNLSALIHNTGECFGVDSIIFSLRNYHGALSQIANRQLKIESKAMVKSATSESAEEYTKIGDESKIYRIERPIHLSKEINVPLWTRSYLTRQSMIPRIYFYFLGDNKVYYGYEIYDTADDFFPAGTVQIFNNDGTGLKEFPTSGSSKHHVRFLVDESLDITVTPNVQKNNQEVTEYILSVNSLKQQPVLFRLIQKARKYKRIISEQRYIEDRSWEEIIWESIIQPGDNEITGAFTIVSS